MATLVLRFKTRDEVGGGLFGHIVGWTRPQTARPREGMPRVINLIDEAFWRDALAVRYRDEEAGTNKEREEGREPPPLPRSPAVEAGRKAATKALAKAKGRRGRRPKVSLDGLVAGPPPFERDPDDAASEEPWTLNQIKAWGWAALKALREGLGPACEIVAACAHLDENSPHLHFQAIPIDGEGELGFARVRNAWARRAGLGPPEADQKGALGADGKPRKRLRSAAEVGRSQDYASAAASAIQSWFHGRVGKPFDLDRGEVGSRRTHRAVDQLAGVERRLQAETGKLRKAEGRRHRALSAASQARERQAGALMAAAAAEEQEAAAEARRQEAVETVARCEVQLADQRRAVAAVREKHRSLEKEYQTKRRELAQAHEQDKAGLEAQLAELRVEARTAREERDGALKDQAATEKALAGVREQHAREEQGLERVRAQTEQQIHRRDDAHGQAVREEDRLARLEAQVRGRKETSAEALAQLQAMARSRGRLEVEMRDLERRREALLEREAAEATTTSFGRPWTGDARATVLREVGHDLGALLVRVPGGIPGADESGSPGNVFVQAVGALECEGARLDVRPVLDRTAEEAPDRSFER